MGQNVTVDFWDQLRNFEQNISYLKPIKQTVHSKLDRTEWHILLLS